MERFNSYILLFDELLEQFLIEKNQQYEKAEPCPQLSEKVLFVDKILPEMLRLFPSFYKSDSFGKSFVCYFDDGSTEITVVNNEYLNYEIESLYFERSGKYDVIDTTC